MIVDLLFQISPIFRLEYEESFMNFARSEKNPAKCLDKSLTRRYNGINETARVLKTKMFSVPFLYFCYRPIG